MRSPLNKRLFRELRAEFGKYLVIFILMTLTIGKAMEILLFMIIVFFKLMNHYSNFHVFCLYAESGYLLYTFFARTFDETAKKHYNTFIYA